MNQVTVSSKFQVVIPRQVREFMDIQPGTRVQVLQYENRIELIPVKGPKSLRGFIRGLIRRWIARGSSMNLVDSCGWLEYFADGPHADFDAVAIEDTGFCSGSRAAPGNPFYCKALLC